MVSVDGRGRILRFNWLLPRGRLGASCRRSQGHGLNNHIRVDVSKKEDGCSSSRPQSNLACVLVYVLHMGGHVLLRADPVHVRGANGTMGRSLLILHKTSPSMAEILLGRV